MKSQRQSNAHCVIGRFKVTNSISKIKPKLVCGLISNDALSE